MPFIGPNVAHPTEVTGNAGTPFVGGGVPDAPCRSIDNHRGYREMYTLPP